MRIDPFLVEQWMNAHETTATWNTAETCVDSFTLDELLELSGDGDEVLRRLRATRLDYGHINGSPRLRAAIAALYGERTSADNILVANGAIGANFLVLFALTEPGTRVVVAEPTYQQHFSVPEAIGADVQPLRLREENGYLPDPDELRALTAEANTSLIVIGNPNNPTGALMDEAHLREIVAIAREAGAWLLCDEAYRGLEHEPTEATSIVDLYERGVSTGSMSKTYSLAGLRAGWVAAPPAAIAHCLDIRDYTTISCGVIDDVLATVALEHREAILARNLPLVRGNLALVDEWIAREPRLRYVRPRAGTTALIRYQYDLPSTEFCEGMFAREGAFVTPGSAFGEEYAFRIGYACARATLVGGLAAISAYLRTLE